MRNVARAALCSSNHVLHTCAGVAVGTAAPFSLAVATILTGDVDETRAGEARPVDRPPQDAR
eukprot:6464212-Amphidinium_carterae.1